MRAAGTRGHAIVRKTSAAHLRVRPFRPRPLPPALAAHRGGPAPQERSSRAGATTMSRTAGSAAAPPRSRPSTSRPRPAASPLTLTPGRDLVTPSGAPVLVGVPDCWEARRDANGDSDGAAHEGGGHGTILRLRCPDGRPRATADAVLGSLRLDRFLACARKKIWWMIPNWGSHAKDLVGETQYMLGEVEGTGEYVCMCGMLDDGRFRSTMRGPGRPRGLLGGPASPDSVCVRVESGRDETAAAEWGQVVYVATGGDPFALAERVVHRAAFLSGGARPRQSKQPPAFLDLFGWCTWDAFYSAVDSDGIERGMSALEQAGVTPGFVIIDDGWQQVAPAEEFRRPDNVMLSEFSDMREGLSAAGKNEAEKRTAKLVKEATNMAPVTASQILATTVETLLGEEAPRPTLWETVVGGVLAQGTRAIMWAYQELVDPAPPFSIPFYVWRCFARGVGRGALLAFYADFGDHSKRLCGVTENDKFERPPTLAASATRVSVLRDESGADIGETLESVTTVMGESIDGDGGTNMVDKRDGGEVGNGVGNGDEGSEGKEGSGKGSVQGVRVSEDGRLGLGGGMAGAAVANGGVRTGTSAGAGAGASVGDVGAGRGVDEVVGGGLRMLVARMKKRYGVKLVLCWHALSGYWCGVSPDAREIQSLGTPVAICHATPSDGVLEIEPSMAWSQPTLAGVGICKDPYQLHSAMHRHLRSAGVDGVKVDVQSGLTVMASPYGGYTELARSYNASLERSVKENFPGNVLINCMCHSIDNVMHFSDSAVARASDDFYPRDPAAGAPHVAACAFNSVFLGALVVPDWDMFHSVHPDATLHATARAISGGPVYVSDRPGKHDCKLIRRLVLKGGEVPRGMFPGRPTRDCLLRDVQRDGETALKVWNGGAVAGEVAVFNVQGAAWDRTRRKFMRLTESPAQVVAEVRAWDVDGMRGEWGAAEEVAAMRHGDQSVAVMGREEAMRIELPPTTSEMVTICPVTPLPCGARVAPLGLAGMLNGAFTVAKAGADGARAFEAAVAGPGRAAFYASRMPEAITVGGADVTRQCTYDDNTGALHVPVEADNNAIRLRF